MKNKYINTKIINIQSRFTKYLVDRLMYIYAQINKTGVISQSNNYFYSDYTKEFVSDISKSEWITVDNIEAAVSLDRSRYNDAILNLYNFNKPVDKTFRWKTMTNLYGANLGMQVNIPMGQVNVVSENGDVEGIAEKSLSDFDSVNMDEM